MMKMIREEGALRPLRGMGAMVAGAGPAHALYFGSYERLKVVFNGSGLSANQNYLAQGAAGSVATLLHDAIMTPAEGTCLRFSLFPILILCFVSPSNDILLCFFSFARGFVSIFLTFEECLNLFQQITVGSISDCITHSYLANLASIYLIFLR